MTENKEINISPVQYVTIKSKSPLFKGTEAATAIEKIEVEENGFSLVSQKDLYNVGDKAVYIQPDYNLSEQPLFESFIRPGGDPKKSRLGSNNRIRAIKFNLHTGDDNPVYSVGILLPLSEVESYYGKSKTEEELVKVMDIKKWEEPDTTNGLNHGRSKPFPNGMYKTDETNINNLWGKIKYPITLVGSEKCDGSSTTLFSRINPATKEVTDGICSRQLLKPLVYTKVVGFNKPNFFKQLFDTIATKLKLSKTPDYNIYEEVESEDSFVVLSKPYLEKFSDYCKENNLSLALRAEANGVGFKGSGNKNNPASKESSNLKFFGLDDYSTGTTIPMGEVALQDVLDALEFQRCKIVFRKTFFSKEELVKECEDYFADNLIEGIVVRTMDHRFSAKFMNNLYDSKK